MLSATGGARPTGIGWFDAVLLGLGGAAAAACGVRARTVPVYVAAGAAALCQPAVVPLALGCLALVAALARRLLPRRSVAGALAGGLTWAATVGAPFEPGARPLVVPLLALGWVVLSARRNSNKRFRQRLERVAIGAGLLVLVGAGLGALAVVNARAHVERGADLVASGLDAARAGDTDRAVDQLRGAQRALARGESSLGASWARPSWLVPGVSQNARTLHQIVAEVGDVAGAGIRTVEDANVDALRASGGQIDLAAVTAMEEPLAQVLTDLEATDARLADIDRWLLPPVADRLDEARDELADTLRSGYLALDGLRVAPHLLGADEPRTYLVLFTTPVEARATTGFPGNFAEVTFTDGRFDMTRFGRISELNDALPPGGATLMGPDDYLARYEQYGVREEWRNITMSPDFPSVAAVAAELYPQSGGRPVNGVLSVDPVALAAVLRLTGPVAVPGVPEPLTAYNAAQFLLLDQYVEIEENPDRIDALESLAEVAFDRLQTADLPAPGELGDIFGPVVEQKHLQLVAFDEGAGAFLARLGITGRYPPVRGDFVGVTTTNAGAGKIDLFLRRSLGYDVRWDPSTGEVRATATITLTNEAPASGLPDYVIGNLLGRRPLEESVPPGWNTTLLTLYTPLSDDGVTLDGEPVGVSRVDELGRSALSLRVQIPPGATRTVIVELSGVVPLGAYRLTMAAQPLVEPEQAAVAITASGGGRFTVRGPLDLRGQVASGTFPLVQDEEIGLSER